MAESGHESLLNNLLKSRYPLTYYLSRQQNFNVETIDCQASECT